MSDVAISDRTPAVEVEARLADLARRHRAAGGLGMKLVGLAGGAAQNLLERLPDRVKDGLEEATAVALERALDAAAVSRGMVADRGDWLNSVVTAALGAAGGVGGLPTALAELPVTTTILLRAIQGIAAEHGFDPSDEATRADCIRVFASAGPLSADDAGDLGFLAARVTISARPLQTLIAKVAPRLSAVFGQKLAAQAAPVAGAVTGAWINYVFTSYYQEMARVHFGLRKLAEETGEDREALAGRLRGKLVAKG